MQAAGYSNGKMPIVGLRCYFIPKTHRLQRQMTMSNDHSKMTLFNKYCTSVY